MKKTICLLLVLTLFLAFAACNRGPSTDASDADAVDPAMKALAGEYLCTMMDSDGLALDPSAMGLNIVLTLNADGTGNIQYADPEVGPKAFGWTLDGSSITMVYTDPNTKDATATVNAGKITVQEDGYVMEFTRK